MIALLDRAGNNATVVGLLHALLSDATLPCYLEALSHTNPRVVRAISGLLIGADQLQLSPLIEGFRDAGSPKKVLTDILLAHRDRLQVGAMFRTLHELPPRARPPLFRLVEQILDEEHIGDLMQLLTISDGALRINVIHVLGRFPTPRVRDLLLALLGEPEKSTRLATLEVLARFPMPFDAKAVCALLRDPDITIQAQAVDVLGQRNDSKAMGYLLEVMQDESEYSRRAAVEVLNRIGTVDAIRDLVSALRDQDWWVRVRAADALGSIGGQKVVEAVLSLLDSEDTFVRRIAVEVLNSNHNEQSRPALEKALEDSDWWVRERAVDALGALGNPLSVPPLVALLERNIDAAPYVLGALSEIGDPSAAPAIEELSQRGSRLLRKEASRVLAVLRGEMPRSRSGPVKRDLPLDDLRPSNHASSSMSMSSSTTETLLGSRSKESGGAAPDGQGHEWLPKTTGSYVNVDGLAPGDLLSSRYRVIRHIGHGAFGDVILMKDETVGEEVILKFLHRHLIGDREVLHRFVHELRFARRITHPNVIRIHDFIAIGKSYAMSMEYFESRSLGSILKKERPDRVRSLQIMHDVCSGMVVAHEAGVVHRDLKPGNILINEAGVVKIVDFGLAAATGDMGSRMTQAGMVLGTPSYMAPEQVRGKAIDLRTDIYSLGVIMYELFTGRLPYKAREPMSIMYQHVEGKLVPPRERDASIPEALEMVILKCMAVDPDARYQKMSELAMAIDLLATGEE